MPIAYSNRSFESISWNGCTICPSKEAQNEWHRAVEKHSRAIRQNSLFYKQLSNLNYNNNNNNNYYQTSPSISLKNLTNLQALNQKVRKSNSYLNIHMDEVIKKKEEEQQQENEQIVRESSKLLSSAKTIENHNNNKNNSLSFIKNLRKSATLTFNQFSNNLVKRKKVSLRV
jgi:hypothetical protein